MALVTANGIDELKALIGQEVGPSDWREVTQELINTFAEVGASAGFDFSPEELERAHAVDWRMRSARYSR